jgi:hypothetical protein
MPDVLVVSLPADLLMLPMLMSMVSVLLRLGPEPGFSDIPTGSPLIVWGLAYAEAGRLLILAMMLTCGLVVSARQVASQAHTVIGCRAALFQLQSCAFAAFVFLLVVLLERFFNQSNVLLLV